MEGEEKHGTCSGRTEKGEGLSCFSTLEKRRLESGFADDDSGDGTTLLGLRLDGRISCFPSSTGDCVTSGTGDCVTSGTGDRISAGTTVGRFTPEHVLAIPASPSSAGFALVLNHGVDSAAAAVSRAAACTASRPAPRSRVKDQRA